VCPVTCFGPAPRTFHQAENLGGSWYAAYTIEPPDRWPESPNIRWAMPAPHGYRGSRAHSRHEFYQVASAAAPPLVRFEGPRSVHRAAAREHHLCGVGAGRATRSLLLRLPSTASPAITCSPTGSRALRARPPRSFFSPNADGPLAVRALVRRAGRVRARTAAPLAPGSPVRKPVD